MWIFGNYSFVNKPCKWISLRLNPRIPDPGQIKHIFQQNGWKVVTEMVVKEMKRNFGLFSSTMANCFSQLHNFNKQDYYEQNTKRTFFHSFFPNLQVWENSKFFFKGAKMKSKTWMGVAKISFNPCPCHLKNPYLKILIALWKKISFSTKNPNTLSSLFKVLTRHLRLRIFHRFFFRSKKQAANWPLRGSVQA